MKKLSIEEKAKRYDEAIKKAKSKIKNDKDHVLYEDDVIEMFPELKESEDERIRKRIINALHGDVLDMEETAKAIAWLEKQGEQNPAEWHREDEQNLNACLGYIPDEPKFKIGDWLVHNERRNIIKIVNATPLVYEVVNVLGYHYTITDTAIENNYHLWSIADAKDGDVLHSTGWHNDCIFIFNRLDNWKFDKSNGDRAVATGYCCLSVSADNMEFGIQGPDCIEVDTVKPATNIQRNLLEKAMADAGYTFNFEKKKLEKISQKPADKVEPKFHEGDWVIGSVTSNEPRQIEEITEEGYKTTYGGWIGFSFEEDMHLWSIADAKDGDVLAYNDGSLTIFRYRLSGLNAGLYMSYVLLTDKIEFKQTCVSNSHPATKEQRDLLFQKMKEAGYEWDADKKELRKIKQHAWNEEDDGMLHGIIAFISTTGCIVEGFKTWIDWLKSLKDRVQPQPKQEWNEEDEKMFKDIVTRLFSHPDVDKTEYDKSYHWLKSLRPQNNW